MVAPLMGVLYGEFMDTDESQTEIEPQREGIIAAYVEDGLGYLIQQANGGYRYLQVESGEEDEVGDLVGTRRAAIALAVIRGDISVEVVMSPLMLITASELV